jgi:hypothetical protein
LRQDLGLASQRFAVHQYVDAVTGLIELVGEECPAAARSALTELDAEEIGQELTQWELAQPTGSSLQINGRASTLTVTRIGAGPPWSRCTSMSASRRKRVDGFASVAAS